MSKATVNSTSADEKVNDICKGCVKWEMFKAGCWVHWHGKTFCTQRAANHEEMRELELLKQ